MVAMPRFTSASAAIALALVAGCSSSGDDSATTSTTAQKFDTVLPAVTTEATTSAAPPATTEPNPPTMSRAEFEQITEGMTLAEVVEVVGGPGQQAGGTGAGPIRYQWESDCGPGLGFSATVVVQGGEVVSTSDNLGPDDVAGCKAGAVRASLNASGYAALAEGVDDAEITALGAATCEVAEASASIEAFIPDVQSIDGLGGSAEEQGAMARALTAAYCPAEFERLMG
jgi:hypothetical protein